MGFLKEENWKDLESKLQSTKESGIGNGLKDIMYRWTLLTTEKHTREEKLVYADFVEINSWMTLDNHIIHQYWEIFIQFSYFSLYAVACPIASVTVFIYNLIEIYGNKNLMIKAF